MKGALNRIKGPLDNKWNGVHEKLEQDINAKKQSPSKAKGLDIQHLEMIKEPKEATTSLEFLICTLGNKFELKTSQVREKV